MDLDELKQTWKENIPHKPVNKNIMEMIQHKSYGPVAALKRSYKKQMVIMAIMPFVLLSTNANNIQGVLSSILYWCYVALCIGIIFFSFLNYKAANKMQVMDGMVKQNLEQQVQLLQSRLYWNIIGLRIALLFFVVLLEVIPYFQHYRMLDKWHSLPIFVRYGLYAGMFVMQYFLSPVVMQRKFGRHITYLKELIKDM